MTVEIISIYSSTHDTSLELIFIRPQVKVSFFYFLCLFLRGLGCLLLLCLLPFSHDSKLGFRLRNMVRKLSTSSFYIQLYQIIDDRSSDQIISWNKSNNNSFIVWDLKKLRSNILPKSSSVLGKNMTEFIAKLRSHGFKTVVKGPGELEFSHDDFERGPLMKKMMVKALSERIERFDAQIKSMKCRLKAKEASLKVENLFQNLRI